MYVDKVSQLSYSSLSAARVYLSFVINKRTATKSLQPFYGNFSISVYLTYLLINDSTPTGT